MNDLSYSNYNLRIPGFKLFFLSLLFINHLWMILTLVGCSSLNVVLPSARLENPETIDSTQKYALELGLGMSTEYNSTSDASYRPPTLSQPAVSNRLAGMGRFTYPLHPKFEVSAAFHTSLSSSNGYSLGGKYQFFGPSTLRAKMGDESLSVSARLFYASTSNHGEQNGVLGHGGYPWNGTLKILRPDLGLIYGKRWADDTLVYGGPFIQSGQLQTEIIQEATSPSISNPDGGGKYSQTSQLSVYGAHMGMMFINSSNNRSYVIEYVIQKERFGDGQIDEVTHRLNLLVRAMGAIGPKDIEKNP